MTKNPENRAATCRVGLTKFGWLYTVECRVLLRDHNNDGIYPDVCPICKRPLDYSILDELKRQIVPLD